MKNLSSVAVTSHGFITGLGVLLLVLLVATALFLEHRVRSARAAATGADAASEPAPARRRRRRGLVLAVVALVACQVLTITVGAARINGKMQFAATLGDVAGIVSGSSQPRSARLGNQTPQPTDVSTPASAWTATMSPAAYGFTKTTFTGPISGIKQEVWVWTPQGYSPKDGKTYNVIVFLHGDPGTPDGTAQALQAAATMQKAVSDGTIPPTIFVIPSLNADDSQRTQPDCANIVGHAQVGTWLQAEVPQMIKATFPNVTTDRHGWAIAGLSSGAYCSLWTGIRRSDVYGTVMAMSGYDAPVLGGMSTTDRLRQQNTISTLLAHASHQPLDIWVMGAKDDPDAAAIVEKLPVVAPRTDHVTPALVPSGGHSWTLWAAQLPNALSWWGATLRGEVTPSAPPSPTATATAHVSTGSGASASTGLLARARASLTGIKGNGLLALLVVLASVLSVAAVSPWGPAGRAVRPTRPGRRPQPVDGAAPGTATGAPTNGGDQDDGVRPTEPARPTRRTRRADGARRARSVRRERLVGALRVGARTVVLIGSCLAVALLAGVVANRLGDFYPSWELAWSDLGSAFL